MVPPAPPRLMPRPVEAFPCGSRSSNSTRSPTAASAVARLIAVVVLPTPPFWLETESTRSGESDMLEPLQAHDSSPGMAAAFDQVSLETPRYCSGLQLGRNILSLEEESDHATLQVGPSITEKSDQRGARARHDDVAVEPKILGAGVVDLGRQLKLADHRFEEAAALRHALNQMDDGARPVLEQDGQNDPRKAGARSDVDPAPRPRRQREQLRAVEGVTQPEGR